MDAVNTDSESFVLWQWAANGTGTSNSEGSGITSTVSANTTAGFSVATFTGTGGNASVGHGLSAAPEFVMIKNTDTTNNWAAGHTSMTNWNYYFVLDQNVGQADTPTIFNGGSYPNGPTASVVHLGSSSQSNGANTMVMWCWHGVEGYSQFGSFVGNNSTDGPVISMSFAPAYFMFKRIDGNGDWYTFDSSRNTYNPANNILALNQTNTESTMASNSSNGKIDFLSNGIKFRSGNGSDFNGSGVNFLYAAWASDPFGGSGVNQAKAR